MPTKQTAAKQKISKARILAIILCISGLMFGVTAVLRQQMEYSKGEEIADAAIQVAARPKTSDTPAAEGQIVGSDNVSISADPDIEWISSINMDELRLTNPDVLGWIMVPGTDISYPLLQTTDNEYYLKHAWDGTKNTCGSIFMDYRSNLDDWNAVIYGHNMKDGSMFADLRKYQENEFVEEHPSLYILCNNRIWEYTFSAAFEAELDGVPYVFGDMNEEAGREFMEQLSVKAGVEISGPAASLSTCTGRGHQTRWVVIFSLLSETEI